MFGFLKKNVTDKNKKIRTLTMNISGMHCTSCAMNIDGELEDLEGVVSATTNYAQAVTQVKFDPQKVTLTKIQQTIMGLGYTIKE